MAQPQKARSSKHWATTSMGKEAGKRRGPDAKLSLKQSYDAFFHGGMSDAQREIVIADLANFSNFYAVGVADMSAEERAYREGQRSVYGRMMQHVRMTQLEQDALERAIREEAFVDMTEGELI